MNPDSNPRWLEAKLTPDFDPTVLDKQPKPDGGPAFPHDRVDQLPSGLGGHHFTEKHYTVSGMSLRDYFAGQALTGVIDKDLFMDSMTAQECDLQIHNATVLAYRLSDAMIAYRDKR